MCLICKGVFFPFFFLSLSPSLQSPAERGKKKGGGKKEEKILIKGFLRESETSERSEIEMNQPVVSVAKKKKKKKTE